jgi:hypothetical protein
MDIMEAGYRVDGTASGLDYSNKELVQAARQMSNP